MLAYLNFALIFLQYLEDEEVLDLLNEITNSALSSTWFTRHGAVLTISSMLKHSPAIICTSSSYGAVVNCLKSSLKDEKVFGFLFTLLVFYHVK